MATTVLLSPDSESESESERVLMGADREEKVWGEYQPHAHTSLKNVGNAVLTLTACLPSILLVYWIRQQQAGDGGDADSNSTRSRNVAEFLSNLDTNHPNLMLHVLFGANISFGFWFVGLVQRSFWLIDPYWSLFPVLAALYYCTRTGAQGVRSSPPLAVAVSLLVLWSIRITYSYFRREGWKFGEREDWRYTDMAKRYRKHWWWMSFWAVGVAQQFMLVPLVYPMYTITLASGGVEWTIVDSFATGGSLLGIGIACVADNQLYSYCNRSKKEKPPVLSEGLWSLSRHPNYVGEQIWWWSFALFAVARSDYLALIGAFINSCVLVHVTGLTEKHMLSTWNKQRVQEYKRYAKVTPSWLPFFPKMTST